MLFFYFLSLFNSSAGEPGDPKVGMEIVVEAHKDFEVYVAPIKYNIDDDSIEAFVDPESVFAYSSQHWHMAKIDNGYGGYEPIKLNTDGFRVYSEDTIKYAWDNCNYSRDSKACSFKNNHYLLETTISVDENELVVNMMLYDSSLQVVARGSSSSRKKVKWIKQQASNSSSVSSSNISPQNNCTAQSCTQPNLNSANLSLNSVNITTNSNDKEELPLKFEVPHRLLDKHIHQASMGLWLSLRIK